MNNLSIVLPKNLWNHYEYSDDKSSGNFVTRKLQKADIKPNTHYTTWVAGSHIDGRGYSTIDDYHSGTFRIGHDSKGIYAEDTLNNTTQKIINDGNRQIKATIIGDYSKGDKRVKSVQVLQPDGYYSVARYNRQGRQIGGYEVLPNNRKFATSGLAAKLEKLALKIGTDVNGCERPVLRRLAGFIFDVAKKVR